MVYSARSDAGTRSQFTRRKKVIITTDGTSTPTDYQVKLTIAYEPGMQADFDDIRFNTLSIGYIDYWIESYTASTTATVWVKLPDAITHPGSDTVWMYYGNSGLSDGGIGADTFIQYHGSATTTYHDSNVFLNNIVYESKFKRTVDTHNILLGTSDEAATGGDTFQIQTYSVSDLRYFYTKNDGTQTQVNEAPAFPLDTYVQVKITFDSSNAHAYIDDNEISSGSSTNLPNENMGLWLYVATGTCVQDWSWVRKYIANEPTLSYGTAQHQRRIPQFIG